MMLSWWFFPEQEHSGSSAIFGPLATLGLIPPPFDKNLSPYEMTGFKSPIFKLSRLPDIWETIGPTYRRRSRILGKAPCSNLIQRGKLRTTLFTLWTCKMAVLRSGI